VFWRRSFGTILYQATVSLISLTSVRSSGCIRLSAGCSLFLNRARQQDSRRYNQGNLEPPIDLSVLSSSVGRSRCKGLLGVASPILAPGIVVLSSSTSCSGTGSWPGVFQVSAVWNMRSRSIYLAIAAASVRPRCSSKYGTQIANVDARSILKICSRKWNERTNI
jgi:hypothetical protein